LRRLARAETIRSAMKLFPSLALPSLAGLLTGLLAGLPGLPGAAASVAGPQDARTTADEPLPPGVAARVGDEQITFAEYQAYLLRIYGAGPLKDLVLSKLLEREAARLGLAVDEAEVDAELGRFWDGYVRRFRGDEQALERELAAAGFTVDAYRAKMREELRRDLLEARILLATRVVGEDALRARFEQRYGEGGVKVRVRHLLFTVARARADLARRGVPSAEIDDARVQVELDALCERARARLADGEAFELVARTDSHDASARQNGGFIPGYNYDRYGAGFADAVRAAEVGVVVGPIPSPVGRHLIEVTERVTTRLGQVRDELVAELSAEPPSWLERSELRLRLRAEARVQTYR